MSDFLSLEIDEQLSDISEKLFELDLIELLSSIITENLYYKILISKERRKVNGVLEYVRIPMLFSVTHYVEDNFRELKKYATKLLKDCIKVNGKFIDDDVLIKLKSNIVYRNKILREIIKDYIENVPEVNEDDFIHPPYIINCLNGVLNLITKEFRKQTPNDLFLFVAGANYIPGHTELPRILNKSLLRTLGPNHNVDSVYYEDNYAEKRVESFLGCIGYCFTQETLLRKCICLIGEGATGKSTLLRYIQSLLGGYGGVLTRTALNYRRGSDPTINNDFVDNRNKSAITLNELNEQDTLDDAPVKTVLGQDMQSYRRTSGQLVHFLVKFKIIIASNFFPKIRNLKDAALQGRFLVFQFLNGYSDEEKDPFFEVKLNDKQTRDQSFSCFIHNAMKFYENDRKVYIHSSVQGDLDYYIMLQEDPVVNFFNEKVQHYQDDTSAILTKDIYNIFIRELYQKGYDKEVTMAKFSKRFKEISELRGIGEKIKSKNNLSAYKNMRIVNVPIYRINNIRGQFRNPVNHSFLQGNGYAGELELA